MKEFKNVFARNGFKFNTFNVILILLITFLLLYTVYSEISTHIWCQAPKHNVDATSRSVWPEQLPNGDRIREQFSYVPNGYKYDLTPIKRILIHTGIGDVWERPKLDQGQFMGCAVSQCWLTVDKSYGPEVDAVLFRHHYTRPLYKRPPNQIWIMELTEAPPHSTSHIDDANAFNWTATYRWDSELPRPYGYFVEHKPPLPPKPLDYPRTKTKKVAWFVSNCHSSSMREVYAAELAKHIDVDIYGACGTLECPRSQEDECFKMMETDYKFYLSFENSHCRYYVTEKLFLNGLKHYVVPIVMGPSRKDYELVAPENSFIHVDDFKSPKELAAYLHKLDKDDKLYEEYFKWKNTGTIIIDTQMYCRLCALLHDTSRPAKNYEDINEWWRGEGVCHTKPLEWNPTNPVLKSP